MSLIEEKKNNWLALLLFHATSKVVIFHQRAIQSTFITNHQSVYILLLNKCIYYIYDL